MVKVRMYFECGECEGLHDTKVSATKCCEVQRDVDPEDTEDNPWLL